MTPEDYIHKIVNLVYDGMIAARDGDLDTADRIAGEITKMLIIALGLEGGSDKT